MTKFLKIISILFVFSTLSHVSAVTPAKPEDVPKAVGPLQKQPIVKVKNQTFQVEIMRTPGEWQKGMMFRSQLAPNAGMLFLGATEKMHFFWMKNTYVSLDLIFISKDFKIVHMATNAPALSEEKIPSVFPANHVLEVVAGTAAKHKWKVGDSVQFINVE